MLTLVLQEQSGTCFSGGMDLDQVRDRERYEKLTSLPKHSPEWLAKLAVEMLEIPSGAAVLDIGCGTGMWLSALRPGTRKTGIEINPIATTIARDLFPDACIVTGDMINHVEDVVGKFDYVIGCPPANIPLERSGAPLELAKHGGRIESHVCALEMAIRAVRPGGYVAIVLPKVMSNEEDRAELINNWLSKEVLTVATIKFPDYFMDDIDDDGMTLYVFKVGRPSAPLSMWWKKAPDSEREPFSMFVDSLEGSRTVLLNWQDTKHYEGYEYWPDYKSVSEASLEIAAYPREVVVLAEKESVNPITPTGSGKLVDAERAVITIALGERDILLKANGLKAALRIAEAKERGMVLVDWGRRNHKLAWNESLRLKNAYRQTGVVEELEAFKNLQALGCEVEIDPGFRSWLAKKHRWWIRQCAPYEQWVQRTEESDWELLNADNGIRTTHADFYAMQSIRLEKLAWYYPFINELWTSQRDDIIRASMKQSVMMAKQQGLGKTRSAFAWALLTGCNHALFVVPGHLLGEWEEEADECGLELNVIETEADLANLGHLNLITYDLLASPLNEQEAAIAERARKIRKENQYAKYPRHKTFAHVLARRVRAVSYDESHLMSNNQTLRTRAGKRLKPKWKLTLTGTPVNNRVNGLWSILDVMYSGSYATHTGHPLFEYNYKEFQETFVTTGTVVSSYEKKRSTVQRAQIRDLDKFRELMAPKMIRRVQREPEVEKDVKIPDYRLHEHNVRPDRKHLAHYKWHLVEFANWLKKQIANERNGQKMSSTALFAQLGRLAFASTIPQHPKVNLEANPWHGEKTEKQRKFIELVIQELKAGNRVFVAGLRPDFATQARKWLEAEGIKAVEFTGQINRRERIALKKRIKYDESIQVVLGTYGVVATGLNLYFLQAAILVDLDWTWSRVEQTIYRLLRAKQRVIPNIHIVYNEGMLDSYMRQHVVDKRAGTSEALDYREDVEGVDEWVSWREFSIKMLIEEGLWDD